MERRTITQLGELREGDRFVFKTSSDVWEVIKKDGNRVEVNVPENGRFRYRYNERKSGSLPVMFLRHSKPIPGDHCFIEDLNDGDVFRKPGDINTEWEIVGKGNQFSKIKKVYDKICEYPEMAGIAAQVILVRRKNQGI